MTECQACSCESIGGEQAVKCTDGGIRGKVGTSDVIYDCAGILIASCVSFIVVVVILRRGIEGTRASL